jgi:hypothetical protein
MFSKMKRGCKMNRKRQVAMDRRGQAAMEFLMTYGWAILAAIIAIGVLAYFGVFSPGKYTTGSTVLNPPFYANAWNVKPAEINIEVKNNGGEKLFITAVNIPDCNDGAGGSWTVDTGADPPRHELIVDVGKTNLTTVTCNTGNAGTSFKSDVVIEYRKEGSSLALTSSGTIADKITA